VVLSLLLTQGNITAQKVIDNEALSSDQDEKRSNNAESGSDLNELAAKPLVHVSIEGTEINDKIRGGDGNDVMSGEDGQDTLQGQDGDDEIDGGDDDDDIKGGLGDDEIDGGDGKDLVEGGEGKDKLEGGNDADRFVCDEEDKISDYNSLENDIIIGECDYEDKGLIPPPSSEEGPIPATLRDSDGQDNNNNFKSFDSRESNVPNGQDNIFKKFLSKLINKDLPPIFDN
jgi:hypothetical protein